MAKLRMSSKTHRLELVKNFLSLPVIQHDRLTKDLELEDMFKTVGVVFNEKTIQQKCPKQPFGQPIGGEYDCCLLSTCHH